MPHLTFHPLGNADCCLIELAAGERILFDYANVRNADDSADRRIDLERSLRQDLRSARRDFYDAVAFTHLDDDHIHGASDFFHLEHAQKYQTAGRIKIRTLWVPAAVVIEEGSDGEAAIIRAEARHRLIQGKGIRVFSRPPKLEAWLKKQGLTLASRQHLITDAGQLAPEFTLAQHGVEFFIHSPFASRLEDGSVVDRNIDSLVMQATFLVQGVTTKLMLGSDVDHAALTDIVNITKYHHNEARLEWDVFKLPHHCSFLTLGPEKGKNKTKPVPNVKWLFEDQAQPRAIIVSTSKPIPTDDDDLQPPHRQAANYYKDAISPRLGEFKVTMDHPSVLAPEPLVITIDASKASIRKRVTAAAAAIVSRPAPRAGRPR